MQAKSKALTRKEILARRRSVSDSEVREKSERILNRLYAMEVWSRADQVLLYLPINKEVDTRPLLLRTWREKKTALLPCCRPDEPGIMDFFVVEHEGQLKSGYCSIPEPDRSCCTLVEECSPDLAVIPGVGFDRAGYRLGYGGGYYDRFLTGRTPGHPLVVGLGYALQVVDTLPRDPWDMPMDLVITETGIITGVAS